MEAEAFGLFEIVEAGVWEAEIRRSEIRRRAHGRKEIRSETRIQIRTKARWRTAALQEAKGRG
jgi:hypothetical protein